MFIQNNQAEVFQRVQNRLLEEAEKNYIETRHIYGVDKKELKKIF